MRPEDACAGALVDPGGHVYYREGRKKDICAGCGMKRPTVTVRVTYQKRGRPNEWFERDEEVPKDDY